MTMKTNDLVNILSQSPVPRKPMAFDLAAFGLMIMFAALTILILGVRPELQTFAPPDGFYIKTLVLLGFAVCGLSAIRQAAKPVSKGISWLMILGMPVILGYLVVMEWAHAPIGLSPLKYLLLPNFPACLVIVTLYGSIGAIFLTWLMKQYAPQSERKSAGLIGFAASLFGAVGYSIHCPIDSPTFIAVAYGIPVLGLSLLGALILPRFIRW